MAVLGERAEEGGTNGSAPEPGTLAMAALGLGLLGWTLQRRRRGERS